MLECKCDKRVLINNKKFTFSEFGSISKTASEYCCPHLSPSIVIFIYANNEEEGKMSVLGHSFTAMDKTEVTELPNEKVRWLTSSKV